MKRSLLLFVVVLWGGGCSVPFYLPDHPYIPDVPYRSPTQELPETDVAIEWEDPNKVLVTEVEVITSGSTQRVGAGSRLALAPFFCVLAGEKQCEDLMLREIAREAIRNNRLKIAPLGVMDLPAQLEVASSVGPVRLEGTIAELALLDAVPRLDVTAYGEITGHKGSFHVEILPMLPAEAQEIKEAVQGVIEEEAKHQAAYRASLVETEIRLLEMIDDYRRELEEARYDYRSRGGRSIDDPQLSFLPQRTTPTEGDEGIAEGEAVLGKLERRLNDVQVAINEMGRYEPVQDDGPLPPRGKRVNLQGAEVSMIVRLRDNRTGAVVRMDELYVRDVDVERCMKRLAEKWLDLIGG